MTSSAGPAEELLGAGVPVAHVAFGIQGDDGEGRALDEGLQGLVGEVEVAGQGFLLEERAAELLGARRHLAAQGAVPEVNEHAPRGHHAEEAARHGQHVAPRPGGGGQGEVLLHQPVADAVALHPGHGVEGPGELAAPAPARHEVVRVGPHRALHEVGQPQLAREADEGEVVADHRRDLPPPQHLHRQPLVVLGAEHGPLLRGQRLQLLAHHRAGLERHRFAAELLEARGIARAAGQEGHHHADGPELGQVVVVAGAHLGEDAALQVDAGPRPTPRGAAGGR